MYKTLIVSYQGRISYQLRVKHRKMDTCVVETEREK